MISLTLFNTFAKITNNTKLDHKFKQKKDDKRKYQEPDIGKTAHHPKQKYKINKLADKFKKILDDE